MKRSLSFFALLLFFTSVARGFQSSIQQPLSQYRQFLVASKNIFPPGLYSSASSSEINTASMGTTIKYLLNEGDGIRNIVDDYDVFLLDMWGVMHDGIRPYEGVLEVVKKLKEAGKKLIILSNSSKRRTNSVKMLQKLGFSDDDFDEIITSGEVAHHLLMYLSAGGGEEKSWVPKKIPQAFQNLRHKKSKLSAFCFGSGDGDIEYLNSCGWDLADTVENADLIVARGTFVIHSATDLVDKKKDGEAAYWSAYGAALKTAVAASIPMVVCNPDKVRPDADKSPMPGTIGMAYQEQLTKKHESNEKNDLILSLGKPFPSVYDIALGDETASIDKSRVVMVGDALETDVTGATVLGIDSIWVINDGIHNQDIIESSRSSQKEGCEAVLREFNDSSSTYAQGRKVSPTVVLPHFRW
mmetsp:Transcript_33362/g.37947  ORF Transcript_33362/g.37947 Transcript_33362/m.37947 type:complete len:412 (+) Transcript_33362:129-1364(+)